MKIKKQHLIGGTIIIVILLIALIQTIASNRKQSPQTDTEVPAPIWNNLQPGNSTFDDVVNVLGTPESQDGNVGFFKSKSPSRNHVIATQDGKVSVIRRVNLLEEESMDSLIKEYGEGNITLYGPASDFGYYLFAYPQKGIAFLANPVARNVLEIWYFQPTTLQRFMSQFAPEYSLNLTEEEEKSF